MGRHRLPRCQEACLAAGAQHLRDSAVLKSMLLEQAEAGCIVAAVCASPAVVLATHGLLGARSTCYPADPFKEKLGEWTDAAVVVDGSVITSQGPGTSLQFALKIVEVLYDSSKAEEVAAPLLTTCLP